MTEMFRIAAIKPQKPSRLTARIGSLSPAAVPPGTDSGLAILTDCD